MVLKGRPESGNELAAKDTTEHLDGEKEARAGLNPAGVIERDPTGRHDAVDMGMKPEFLVPGVQYAEETDLGPEMSGVAGADFPGAPGYEKDSGFAEFQREEEDRTTICTDCLATHHKEPSP